MPLTKPRPFGHKKSKSTVEAGKKPSSHKKTTSTFGVSTSISSPRDLRHQQRLDATVLEEEDEYDSGGDTAGASSSRRDEASAGAASPSGGGSSSSAGGLFSMPDFRLQGLLSRAKKKVRERSGRRNTDTDTDEPSGPMSPGDSVSHLHIFLGPHAALQPTSTLVIKYKKQGDWESKTDRSSQLRARVKKE
jgi:hypothetical protein